MLVPLKSRLFRFCEILAWALACCFAFAANGWAQSSAHTISGVIQDQSGAVIPKAEVTVQAGKYRARRLTSAEGEFRFEDLPVVEGMLRVSAANFANVQRKFALPGDERLTIVLMPAASAVQVVVPASRSPEAMEQIAEQVI